MTGDRPFSIASRTQSLWIESPADWFKTRVLDRFCRKTAEDFWCHQSVTRSASFCLWHMIRSCVMCFIMCFYYTTRTMILCLRLYLELHQLLLSVSGLCLKRMLTCSVTLSVCLCSAYGVNREMNVLINDCKMHSPFYCTSLQKFSNSGVKQGSAGFRGRVPPWEPKKQTNM